MLGLTMAELAESIGVAWQTIQQWESGRAAPKRSRVEATAQALRTTPEYLLFGDPAQQGNVRAPFKKVLHEADADGDVGKIPYWDARGSCGGGFLNYEQMPVGHLIKEASFFKRYNLNPANAIAVYADGDSMSDFIVDGDIVIFDTSKTEPVSDRIFLIEHPDGLRIKQLRREIDGSWVLGSRNVDKRRYPDERIDASHADLLRIKGQFVYRQGGG